MWRASQDKRIEREDIDFTCGELWNPSNPQFISVLALQHSERADVHQTLRANMARAASGKLPAARPIAGQLFDGRWLC
jgi:hypothetical protein